VVIKNPAVTSGVEDSLWHNELHVDLSLAATSATCKSMSVGVRFLVARINCRDGFQVVDRKVLLGQIDLKGGYFSYLNTNILTALLSEVSNVTRTK
jgi:hypothetical protein